MAATTDNSDVAAILLNVYRKETGLFDTGTNPVAQ